MNRADADILPALWLAGYTPNPTGPKPIGAGARIPNRNLDNNQPASPGGYDAHNGHRKGGLRYSSDRAAMLDSIREKRMVGYDRVMGPMKVVVRSEIIPGTRNRTSHNVQRRYWLECGHVVERWSKPTTGGWRCRECRGTP